jgi:dihydroorotase
MKFPSPRVLVLRGVRAIDPSQALDAEVDVVVENGVITRLGRDAAGGFQGPSGSGSEGTLEVDGRGKWVLPGLVDLHAHLREPGQEGKENLESGLFAAAAGGFTDVCAMPNTRPVNDSPLITELLLRRARELSPVRLHPIGAITVGQRGEELTEMAALKEAGAIAVSDDGRCVTSSALMRRALEYARTFDLPLIQHAEDIIVARDLILAEYTRARYHVAHLSTLGAARLVREAKSRGLAVTAEVTPHHLLLTHEAVMGYRTACKVNPPLREEEDVEALRQALADGTIDCVATDHAPHGPADKDVPFADAAPGMIGLEICLPLLLGLVKKGALPLGRLVDSLTRAPAKVAGLTAPRLAESARADFVLLDPAYRWTIDPSRLVSRSKNTPFAGVAVEGRVELTVSAGRVAFTVAPAAAEIR